MKKIIQNTAASLAFLILGLFWLASSFSIKVGSAAVSLGGTPRTVPQIVSVVLILVSASILAENLLRAFQARGRDAGMAEEAGEREPLTRFIGVAVIGAAAVLYCLFIGKVGYLPATVVLMGIAAWCFEVRKPAQLATISLLTPTLLYAVFRFLLVVPLP